MATVVSPRVGNGGSRGALETVRGLIKGPGASLTLTEALVLKPFGTACAGAT